VEASLNILREIISSRCNYTCNKPLDFLYVLGELMDAKVRLVADVSIANEGYSHT
jgi:hypothetical protein